MSESKPTRSAGKIVQFSPKPDEAPIKLVEADYRECRHLRFEVHREHPVVFCRDCDTQLDPIFVLRRIASSHAERTWRVAEMKHEADRLEKQTRRQQDGRRSQHRAEGDARAIQHYQQIKARPATAFAGDVALTSDGGASVTEA